MTRSAGILIALALPSLACGPGESPVTSGAPPSGAPVPIVRTSELVAGPEQPDAGLPNPYGGDKNAMAEGEQYYNWFNCTGCHGGAGGGGIGPPFADEDWIYGRDPANVFQSIIQGRPNGMPSYAGRITDEQVWKIVTYVLSLSGAEQASRAGGKGDRRQESRGESGSLEGRPQDRRAK